MMTDSDIGKALHKEYCTIAMEECVEILDSYWTSGYSENFRHEWIELEAVLDLIPQIWGHTFSITHTLEQPSNSTDSFPSYMCRLHQAISKMSRFGPFDINPYSKREAWNQVCHCFQKARYLVALQIDLSMHAGSPTNLSIYRAKVERIQKYLSRGFVATPPMRDVDP